MFRKEAYIYVLLSLLWLAGCAWLCVRYFHDSSVDGMIIVCPIKYLYGIPCPSCGTTRSMLDVLHGDIASAFYRNPLGIVVLVSMVCFPVWLAVDLITYRKTMVIFWQKLHIVLQQKKLAIPVALLLLLNWAWNIYKHN